MKSGFVFNALQEVFSRTYGWTTGSEPYPLRSLAAGELREMQAKTVLDVGCGTGCFAQKDYQYVGIDRNSYYIQFCKRNRPGSFFPMAAESLAFPDQSFDAVFCFSVGHHLRDDSFEKVMSEINRVLKDNGTFLFADVVKPIMASPVAARILEWLDEGDAFRNEHEYLELIKARFAIEKKCKLVDQFHQTIFLRCKKYKHGNS